ncbi:MAG TPA: F0F1 ATP synthase subunit B [bacterium]|nr:F0F1 ATP synthase subunit B [bacterium]HPP88000.1 F0F1 ATP synthase subunit B [bacterium]
MVTINFTILANTISFLVLLYFFSKLLVKPITKILDERAEKIKESYTRAKEEEQRLKEMKEEYTERIQKELNAAIQIRNEARQLAEEEKRKIIEEAKKNAEYMQLKAEKMIQYEYENAKKNLEKEILKYAIVLAEKIVRKEIDEARHRELVKEYLINIGGK